MISLVLRKINKCDYNIGKLTEKLLFHQEIRHSYSISTRRKQNLRLLTRQKEQMQYLEETVRAKTLASLSCCRVAQVALASRRRMSKCWRDFGERRHLAVKTATASWTAAAAAVAAATCQRWSVQRCSYCCRRCCRCNCCRHSGDTSTVGR